MTEENKAPENSEDLKTGDTIKMGNGKEVKINLPTDKVDKAEVENKENANTPEHVEVSSPQDMSLAAVMQKMGELEHKLDDFIGHVREVQYNLGIESSALINIFINRGLLTVKEMQDGVQTMHQKVQEGAQAAEAKGDEPIVVPAGEPQVNPGAPPVQPQPEAPKPEAPKQEEKPPAPEGKE